MDSRGQTLSRCIGLVMVSLMLPVFGQETKEEVPKKMTKQEGYVQSLNETWGYFMSQKMLLERAALTHPELKVPSIQAWADLKKGVIGEALAEVEKQLGESKGKDWEDFQTMVLGQLRAKLAEKDLTEGMAKEIVQKMKTLSAAEVSPDVLMTLISAHPKFVADPIEEVKQGFLRKISSKGMEKAAGVEMEMHCPASWKALDGKTPRIVWRLVSKAGFGSVVSNFTILKLSEKLPLEQVTAALKMPALKKMAPGNSALISAKEMTLGGKPGGMLIYDMFNPAYPGEKIPFRIVQISCIVKGALVQLQFAMSPEKDSELDLNEVTKAHMPLFQFMAESVKFVE